MPFLSVLNDCETKLLVVRNLSTLVDSSLFCHRSIMNSLSLLALSQTDVKQWCTKHEYELLELEKSTTSETDEDEDEEDEEGENNHRKQRKRQRRKKRKSRRRKEEKYSYAISCFSLSGCLWNTTINSNT